MREIRPSGSEGGVALTTPSLPLSPTSPPPSLRDYSYVPVFVVDATPICA